MRGRIVPISPARAFVGDLLHFAARIPTVPVQRTINVGAVAAARGIHPDRPSWTAIFAKAFALVAAERPELRRAFLAWPWPRLVEYPHSVASIALEREWRGERVVMIARVKQPDGLQLSELSAIVRKWQADPLAERREFKRMLALGRCPAFVRRGLWRLALNLPRWRARCLGTFAVTSYAALGAESLHPLVPQTIGLSYGVFAADGSVAVRLVYDHRVLDGADAARALSALDAALQGPILAELRRAEAWIVGRRAA